MALAIGTCALVVVSPHDVPTAEAAAKRPSRRDIFAAKKLAGQALDLMKAGSFEAAIEKFEAADARYPTASLKLQVARCLDKLDRLRDAAAKYREVIAFELQRWHKPAQRKARDEAVPALAKLLEQIPAVAVSVKGEGAARATVEVDGKAVSLDEVSAEREMDPGTHTFVAKAGERIVRRTVKLERGAQQKIVLVLPAPKKEAPPPDDDSALPIAGWVSIGVGGAGILVGAIAGGIVVSQEADLEARCPERLCPPTAHDDARSFESARIASTTGFIIGGVGLAVGTTLLLLAPDGGDEEADPKPAQTRILPYVTPNGVGVAGTF